MATNYFQQLAGRFDPYSGVSGSYTKDYLDAAGATSPYKTDWLTGQQYLPGEYAYGSNAKQRAADYQAALQRAQDLAAATYARRQPRGPNDPAPDIFDQAVARARDQALLGSQIGRTRASTFAAGSPAQPLLSTAALLGGGY